MRMAVTCTMPRSYQVPRESTKYPSFFQGYDLGEVLDMLYVHRQARPDLLEEIKALGFNPELKQTEREEDEEDSCIIMYTFFVLFSFCLNPIRIRPRQLQPSSTFI